MTTTRVYSLAHVYKLFKEAGIHGSYRAVLRREGFRPVKWQTAGVVYFEADPIDEFLRLVKL